MRSPLGSRGPFAQLAPGGEPVRVAQRFNQPRYSSYDIPDWENDAEFPLDSFTFVRIRYYSDHRYGRGGVGWRTDYPDSDLNIAYRLQQLTSIKVQHEPEGKILELTDPELFDYPFIYICEPGSILLTDDERAALRRYLLNGGFLMVDDFWGEAEWQGFHEEIKEVFPNREPVELPLEHPIFHCVYDLKEKPQVPSLGQAIAGRPYGITYERHDAQEVHYRGVFDDKNRLMVMICHNTDLGDGWEREAEDSWYFREFSEKAAYPLGINIIYYAMTH
ncbi:MAG: DUF4159 domain-containing protein [Planctomycetales bacterium]